MTAFPRSRLDQKVVRFGNAKKGREVKGRGVERCSRGQECVPRYTVSTIEELDVTTTGVKSRGTLWSVASTNAR
jgi:hypothetical protein